MRRSNLILFGKSILLCGVSLSPFFLPLPLARAQIAADGQAGANKPNIGAARNGVPMVDIVAPNRSGLSHNKYQEFNIDQKGLILNNHNGENGTSRLGGIAPGNPNLRGSGSAQVILNEVTSGRRSALSGPAEVFGRRADVIIANPNGLSCNGCGFINTPRATLTTGVPQIGADGSLRGFDVRGGDIYFGERGANFTSGGTASGGAAEAGKVDVLDIVARQVRFDGPVAGHDIGVTAGTGHFDYSRREMQALTDIAGKAEFAVDGTALGAMQADKIRIIATEKGVGVRMRGDMAAHVSAVHLSADGQISLNNVSAKGDVSIHSKRGAVQAARLTAKKTIDARAAGNIVLKSAAASGDLRLHAGVNSAGAPSSGSMASAERGSLTLADNAAAGGAAELTARGEVRAAGAAAGGALSVKAGEGINIDTATAGGRLELAAASGNIALREGAQSGAAGSAGGAANIGALEIHAAQGSVRGGRLISGGAMNIQAGAGEIDLASLMSFDAVNLTAAGRLNIAGSALAQGDMALKAAGITAGAAIAGADIAATRQDAAGNLHLRTAEAAGGGKLAAESSAGVNIGQIAARGALAMRAQDSIFYGSALSYDTVSIETQKGSLSLENRLAAAGDISLTAAELDFSNNRAQVQTGRTLTLNADKIDVSGSRLVYGGIALNSKSALNMRGSSLMAVSAKDGSGDIALNIPSLNTDKATEILAARDLTVNAAALDNSGQLAAGRDLALTIRGDAKNSETGLIYAGNNGRFAADGAMLNYFGAIIAKGNLSFTDAAGTGRSRSLFNKAGRIEAGGDLLVKTEHLTNEADRTDARIGEGEYQKDRILFDKPAHYEELGKHNRDFAGQLFHDRKRQHAWGAGRLKKKSSGGITGSSRKMWRVGTPLYGDKSEAFSPITLADGSVYHADNWLFDKTKDNVERYKLNDKAYMEVWTDRQAIENKPQKAAQLSAGGNMVLDVGVLDNKFSSIEAGKDAHITADIIRNSGLAAYETRSVYCGASSACLSYNQDGSRNQAGDIAVQTLGNVQKTAIDTAGSSIKAGGDLQIKAGLLENQAVEGSISGHAALEGKTAVGDPLDALNGISAGDALFTPKIGIEAGLTPPKPNAGGFGGTMPNQDFIYETRAAFLDVGKFYGSAHFLRRIDYNPEHKILFLGDAYFENLLVDTQMRQMTGRGFTPDKSAELMRELLDNGAAYMAAQGLALGEGLSEAQIAALETSMVLYVKRNVQGREAYAPMLYLSAADKARIAASGAQIEAGSVRIEADKISNSGLIAGAGALQILGGAIESFGGDFRAGGDLTLNAADNLHMEAGKTAIHGINVTLPGDLVNAGGNASLTAGQDIVLKGGRIEAGGNAALNAGRDVLLETQAAENSGQAQGIKTASKMQTGAEIKAGQSASIQAGRNIGLTDTKIAAGKNIALNAGENLSLNAARNSQTAQSGHQSARTETLAGSELRAGGDASLSAKNNIAVSASSIHAEGTVGAAAGGNLTIAAAQETAAEQLSSKGFKQNTEQSAAVGSQLSAGKNIALSAGAAEASSSAGAANPAQSGNIAIIGSAVSAGDRLQVEAAGDIAVGAAESSFRQDSRSKSKSGGLLGKKTSEKQHIEASRSLGSELSGGGGLALKSGRDVSISGSVAESGGDLTLNAGRNARIEAAQEHYAEQRQKKSSGFMSQSGSSHSGAGGSIGYGKTKDKYSLNSTRNVQSVLTAERDVRIKAGQNADMQAALLGAGRDISIKAGGNIKLDSAYDTEQSRESHERDFAGITVSASSSLAGAADSLRAAGDRFGRAQGWQSGGNIIAGGLLGLDAWSQIRSANPLGLSGSVSVGAEHSKSKSESTRIKPVATEIAAGRAIEIEAKQGDIHAIGAQIEAGGAGGGKAASSAEGAASAGAASSVGDISLKAGKEIILESAQERLEHHSSSSSSGASLGAGVSAGAGGLGGFGLTGSASSGKSSRSAESIIQHNSHISGSGSVRLESGGDTSLRGAAVSGEKLDVQTGGDLNIESRQDTERSRSRHESASGSFGTMNNAGSIFDKGAGSLGVQSGRGKGDYANVAEQSGLLAGESGFDVKVKGNTDLKGGLIASEAAAEKNRLETGSMTVSDIANHASAEAEESGNSASAGGAMWAGKHGAAKNIIGNIISGGSAEEKAHGQAKSAVAEGSIVINNEAEQRARTGQGAEELIAGLNRDTENANSQVHKIDLRSAEQKAKDEADLKQVLNQLGFEASDDAYNVIFNKEHAIFEVRVEGEGENRRPVYRKLSPEEITNLKKGLNGKVNVSFNGLFNDENKAMNWAVKMAGDDNGPVYAVAFPKANSALGELMVGGYQKVFEDEFWGVSNSGRILNSLKDLYGNSGLEIYGHSRGTMTINNMTDIWVKRGDRGLLNKTHINYFGPGGSAQHGADNQKLLSNGKQDSVNLQNNKGDFVGKIIGGNPVTSGPNNEAGNGLTEAGRIMTGNKINAHGCYGPGASDDCKKRYDPQTWKIKGR